ncbi:serine hydrolase domain-containing protein [Terricaulis sp.]|uniref:serine hydrolase domain-containing protein n=1 Tax=Terricaulis sp. TaxID=2768686 RepID=UPI0037845167
MKAVLLAAGLTLAGASAQAQQMRDGPPEAPPLPALSINAQMSDAELGRALDAWVGGLNGEGRFDGAVLIARDGRQVYAGAFGLADRAANAANRIDTRFPLASIGKVFTAIAIARLEQEGRLRGSDTIAQYITDYPTALSRTATIDQLLNMQGGIADIFGPPFRDADKSEFTGNHAYYEFVAHREPMFAPGAGEEYCNGCYVVLGEIIARVSGMSYEDYVARNILAPTGMTSTGFYRAGALPANTARFYGTPRGPGTPVVDVGEFHGAAGSAAGNIYSTLGDLLLLDNALREHRLLNPQYTAQVLRGEPESARATRRIGFAGGAPGVNTMLHGNGAWTLIILANREPPTAEAVDQVVFPLLAGAASR